MIIAAAIKVGDRVYGLPAPARHHHIIRLLARKGVPAADMRDQGFIDDELGFVDRKVALERVVAEKQPLRSETTILRHELYSEDLW